MNIEEARNVLWLKSNPRPLRMGAVKVHALPELWLSSPERSLKSVSKPKSASWEDLCVDDTTFSQKVVVALKELIHLLAGAEKVIEVNGGYQKNENQKG
jgi:hypothetical protein